MRGARITEGRQPARHKAFDVSISALPGRPSRGKREVWGTLEDIGSVGLSLESPVAFRVGTRVALRVACEEDDGSPSHTPCFAAMGIVRRVGRRPDGERYLLGVEFAAKPAG